MFAPAIELVYYFGLKRLDTLDPICYAISRWHSLSTTLMMYEWPYSPPDCEYPGAPVWPRDLALYRCGAISSAA